MSRSVSLAFKSAREHLKAEAGGMETGSKVRSCNTGRNSSRLFSLLTLNLKIFLPSNVCKRDVPGEGHQAVPLLPDPLYLPLPGVRHGAHAAGLPQGANKSYGEGVGRPPQLIYQTSRFSIYIFLFLSLHHLHVK